MTSNIFIDLAGVRRIRSMEVAKDSHHYIVLSLLHDWLRNIAYPRVQKGTILDFGCGGQPYRDLFLPKASRYIGADVAAAYGVNLDLILVPGEKVPLEDQSVDTVLSTQNIEHIFDFNFYISECARLLKPGGVLILTAPMQWRIHETPYDYWRFTSYGLKGLIEKHDLKLESITPCGGVYALIGQILNSHLAERGTNAPRLYFWINRLALWLDRRFIDYEDTLNWMCIVSKLCHS
jgi:SAM-dependent methyltransferase